MELETGMADQPALDGRGLMRREEVSSATRGRISSARMVLSSRSRNFLNSMARWRAVSWWVTMPEVRLSAANRSMVP